MRHADPLLPPYRPAGRMTIADMPRMPGAVTPAVGVPNSVRDQPTEAMTNLFFATIVSPDEAVCLAASYKAGTCIHAPTGCLVSQGLPGCLVFHTDSLSAGCCCL